MSSPRSFPSVFPFTFPRIRTFHSRIGSGGADLISVSRKPLRERPVEELLAVEFDVMAATAVTQDSKQALERLATRFRTFAAMRATPCQATARAGP